MSRIYFKQAFRSLINQKTYSLVIILGMSIAIAISFLILSYVNYETSYDSFHAEAENLYRINVVGAGVGDNAYKSPYSYAPQGPVAVDEIPEIINYVRLLTWPSVTISSNYSTDKTISISESDYYYADETFFELFTFPLIQGNKSEVLAEPNTVVISQSIANNLFANQDPIGKELKIDGKHTARVTGVFKDIPENTHLKFKVLFSLKTLPWIMNANHAWSNHSLFTYVLLDEGADPRITEKKLHSVFGRENRAKGQMDCTWELQEVYNTYLATADFTSKPDSFKFGNSRMVYFLNLIALLIIVIAWINYINITNSKTAERGKEIGVRRSNGAGKFQILIQFFSESLVYNALSILIAAVIIVFLSSWFTDILSFPVEGILQTKFLYKIAAIIALGILVTGVFTSLSTTYKEKLSNGKGISILSYRQSLVVLQFVIIIGLLSGVFIINKQLKHLSSIDLGFQKDQVIVLNAPRVNFNFREEQKLILFKDELNKRSSIADVTASVSVPGSRFGSGNGGPEFSGKPNDDTYFRIGKVMPNYLEFYGIGIIAGRNFSNNEDFNKQSIIISEEAVHEFGYQLPEEILGKHVKWMDGEYDVIGVTSSFHQESLHIKPEPTIFFTHVLDANYNYLSVKVKSADVEEAIADIESVYTSAFPDNPFNYFFLDSFFEKQYQKDILFRKMFTIFSVLALLIGFFGLYGLTTFRILKRTKEIGIRKVNGATIFEVIAILNEDFVKWVAIAFLLAAPLSWFSMNKWLENFAYKTKLSWWIFALAGLISLIVAMLSISFQSWKAATRNPVEALRYE